MYCSTCGNAVTTDLKYCKNCGDKLVKEVDKDGMPGKMLDNILTTLFLVVMFGLGILVGLVAVLLSRDVQTEVVVLITIAYLAAVFGICYTLLGQVPKLIDAKLNRRNDSPDFVPHVQLPAKVTGQLDGYHEPAMSVTEHTTRTLDKIPVERR
ncbi:MAG: hypothetical protein H7070_02705 [Saprospiraceae bacterium]|nr:hypothetical protein [Pyrinomonadaceae bacterium]